MDYQKLFNLFVSHDDYITGMATPFKQGEYYVATDAHSLIAIKCDKVELDYQEQLKPDALSILSLEENEITLVNIDLIKKFITDNHSTKNEVIEELQICNDCFGSGEVEWEFKRHTMDFECPTCKGDGKAIQEVETDKIVVDSETTYHVFGGNFTYQMLDRLINACTIIGGSCYKVRGSGTASYHFTSGDYRIILMPTMKDSSYTI